MLGFGNISRVKDGSAIAVFLSDLEPHKRLDRIVQLENNSKSLHKTANIYNAASISLGEGFPTTFLKEVVTETMSALYPTPTIESVGTWSVKNTALLAQTFFICCDFSWPRNMYYGGL